MNLHGVEATIEGQPPFKRNIPAGALPVGSTNLFITECPNCKTRQLFEYGQTEITCQYANCNRHVIKIEYTTELFRQIVEKLQQMLLFYENSGTKSKWNGVKIQKFPDGSYITVPQ